MTPVPRCQQPTCCLVRGIVGTDGPALPAAAASAVADSALGPGPGCPREPQEPSLRSWSTTAETMPTPSEAWRPAGTGAVPLSGDLWPTALLLPGAGFWPAAAHAQSRERGVQVAERDEDKVLG